MPHLRRLLRVLGGSTAFLCRSTYQSGHWNASDFWASLNRRSDLPPHRCRLRCRRITAKQQHLQLMCLQRCRNGPRCRGPPPETPIRQTFLAQPEALPIVDQQLQGFPPTAAENKYRAAQRVRGEAIAADLRKSVNTTAEIYGLHRDQHTHLRRYLDHSERRPNAAKTPATSIAIPAPSRTVSRRPLPSATSTTVAAALTGLAAPT